MNSFTRIVLVHMLGMDGIRDVCLMQWEHETDPNGRACCFAEQLYRVAQPHPAPVAGIEIHPGQSVHGPRSCHFGQGRC